MIAADSRPRAYVLSVHSSYGFVYEMMSGISDGLAHHGWQSEVLDVSSVANLMKAVDFLLSEVGRGPALIVDYLAHYHLHTMKAFALHDFFLYFSDAPYAYFDHLTTATAEHVVGYSDEAHAVFHDDHAMNFRREFFPHAGPEIKPNTRPLAEREFPFLVVANLARSPRLDGLGQARANPDIRRLTDAIIARVLDGGAEPYIAFKAACVDLGLSPDVFPAPDHRARYLALLAGWIEAKRRHDILVALRDRPIHIIGNVMTNFFETSMPNLIKLGEKSSKDCMAHMENARVVVNSIGVRPTGAHERMWYGLAAGAAIWTDPTTIVARDFPAGSMFTIPKTAGEIRETAEAISGHADLQGCVTAAQAAYATKHTWRARVGTLLAHHRFEKAMGGRG